MAVIILSCVILILAGHNGEVLAVFGAASGGYLGYDIGKSRHDEDWKQEKTGGLDSRGVGEPEPSRFRRSYSGEGVSTLGVPASTLALICNRARLPPSGPCFEILWDLGDHGV